MEEGDDDTGVFFMMMLQMQQRSRPTVHVDAFLYDEDQVDSLCEEGTMSRCYCLDCGSCRTAPLGQIIIITVMSQLPANTGVGKLFDCSSSLGDQIKKH